MFSTKHSIVLAIAVAIGMMVPIAALAQVTVTGEIHGLVKDPSGAVVPGAQIELKDQATGITKEAKSDAEGSFQFFNLPFGKYQVKVTAAGFQTAVYNDVVVESGRKADLPVNLAVGQPSETVVVQAAAVRLETTSNQVATTINNAYIQALPLINRDTLQFALLMAGSTGSGATATFNGLPNASMN
ncbi:MAG: carboxypeptidase-like regulatory domain-containing protein, partial [Acidobacteriota bacterium]